MVRARRLGHVVATSLALGALTVAVTPAAQAGDSGHGAGRMGPTTARTTAVDPSAGPDFEMPFLCGQRWTGTTRSGHSPSYWTIDWNTPNDLGKPALASAPGVVTRAVTLTGSYGRYVVVDHGGGYTTLYAHLNAIAATVGQVVDQGDLLGYVGGSGNVTGPHLHHEERLDGSYFAPYLHRTRFAFGTTPASASCNDRPVTGDWDGDGTTDVGVFRTSASGTRFWTRTTAGSRTFAWGSVGDQPVVGEYDGDGVSQVGVRRLGSSTWVLRSKTGAAATVPRIGLPTDLPLTGDWDGNGRDNLGYYRFSTHTFYLRAEDGRLTAVPFGSTGDRPVTGDWDGDGTTDVGVFRDGTWRLRAPDGSVLEQRSYGQAGDLPVTGDWNGDGTTDVGVWRPGNGSFYEQVPGADGTSTRYVRYGSPRG